MKKKFETPRVEKKSQAEVDEIIQSVRETALPDATKEFLINCIRLACWFPTLLEKKNISIRRLKEMIFGKKSKKTHSDSDKNGGSSSSNGGALPSSESSEKGDSDNSDRASDTTSSSKKTKSDKPKGKNKGRNPHTTYKEADIEWHTIENIEVGTPCPQPLCTGKMSALPAGVIVQINGQPMAKVTKHFVEKYRCNLCGYSLKAEVPSELKGKQKVYTPEFKAHLALHKFYLAVPYHRMDCYQKMMNLPLPDSTQWDIIKSLAIQCHPIFRALKMLAANSKIIYNDDTVNRILEVIAENKKGGQSRTGMYTTCIMAECEDGHKIALYLNGTQHSGENVEDILELRDKNKKPIIQMSDALALNTPATMATIACYCLSHGFRKIEYLDDYFPLPCHSIMKKLGKVFEIDAKTHEMTDEARLKYHIQHSKPIMFSLYEQINDLLGSSDVEPNGELAKALRYFQKHWVELTRFLSVPGAPIDNNIVERALKLAIRVRKNSLFYKSRDSAALSGQLTSLIYTCTYANVNPVTYLTALQENSEAVTKQPECWLPWNFEAQLNSLTEKASHRATEPVNLPPQANPVATQSAVQPPIG